MKSDDGEILGYSFNFFPGETLGQIRRAVDDFAVPVREALFPRETLGLELRFGLGAIRELGDERALAGIRDLLAERSLEAFTLNGFPISDFHRERVKEDVFRPTWLDEERVEATMRLGEIAAGLLTTRTEGSVSTHPGSFKGWGNTDEVREKVVRNMARVAGRFARLREETGKRIRLCVEPEPMSTFENLAEVFELFEIVDRAGLDELRRSGGMSEEQAREILRSTLALNYDTCHFSVQFEEPEATLGRLAGAGIPLGKMHLSNGLVVERPSENRDGMALLRDLHEPRYLHQVVGIGRDGGIVLREADLAPLFERPDDEIAAIRELRVHFHLPVFFEGGGGCRTTSAETARAYRLARTRGWTRTFAIETYTWDILREKGLVEVPGVVEGLIEEFRWALALRNEAAEETSPDGAGRREEAR